MPEIVRSLEWRITSTSGPMPRMGHTLCPSDDGKSAYLFGGISTEPRKEPPYLSDFWEYSLETKKWRRIELHDSVQWPRAFHSAVWWNNSLVVFGGCNNNGRFNKTFFLYPNGTWAFASNSSTPPSTRYCHSAVVYRDYMYIFGGKSGGRNSNVRLRDLFKFNLAFHEELAHRNWTLCEENGDKPDGRSAHSAVVHRDKMIIFGGRNASAACCDDVCVYDFLTTMWRKFPIRFSPLGRARNSCVVHNGYAILFGGWNGKDKLNDIVFFHIDSGVIREVVQRFPTPRECQVATMCGDTMVVFGGRYRAERMAETFEVDFRMENTVDCILDYLRVERKITLTSDDIQKLPSRLPEAVRAGYSI